MHTKFKEWKKGEKNWCKLLKSNCSGFRVHMWFMTIVHLNTIFNSNCPFYMFLSRSPFSKCHSFFRRCCWWDASSGFWILDISLSVDSIKWERKKNLVFCISLLCNSTFLNMNVCCRNGWIWINQTVWRNEKLSEMNGVLSMKLI